LIKRGDAFSLLAELFSWCGQLSPENLAIHFRLRDLRDGFYQNPDDGGAKNMVTIPNSKKP
jgi:hypothetical protein